ncbi:MAG: adaptor protein MecA [bacterium]|nr:adaptor protein MecA [bacterium]
MKIEKINENQIRCTLNKDDLVDRQLRISELAYGTEKAKLLFRDMMQQAAFEFGFEADDIPLMIEAIPVSPETLILVVTKVEDPDELDTRFSKFSPNFSDSDEFEENDDDDDDLGFDDDLLNSYQDLDNLLELDSEKKPEDKPADTDNSKLNETLSIEPAKESEEKEDATAEKKPAEKIIKIFSFNSLEEVIRVSAELVLSYRGKNDLYKNTANSTYYLVLSQSDYTPQEFNRICNLTSEYGKLERSTYATIAYYKEHFDLIVKEDAVQILSVM